MANLASNAPQLTFRKDESGAIAIIFALMLFVVLGILGLMIDGGRATHAATRAGMALDATALASARAAFEQGLTDGKLDAYAQEFFDANIWGVGGDPTTYENLRVTADAASGDVDVTVTTRVPTYFGGLFGVDEIAFDNASKVNYKVRDLEFGMALDVTGSMGGAGKIQDLRAAGQDLVDILMADGNPARKVRVGLAPYASSVNLGSYIDDVTDPTLATPASTCIQERTDGQLYSAVAPGTGGTNYFTSDVAGLTKSIDTNTPPWWGPVFRCIDPEVMPLSDDAKKLKQQIKALTADGTTAGHIGIQWAWNLVSHDFGVWSGDARPAPKSDLDTIKAVLIMTDGEFQTAYQHGNSNDQALKLCNNMEGEGIHVFTVGFKLNDPVAQKIMADCASTPKGDVKQTAFLAKNGTQLRAAFQKIANQLSTLRVAG